MSTEVNKEELAKSNATYGRLLESVHYTGYSMERACMELADLLENDKWKSVGNGFEKIDDFLKTINLSEFKIAVDRRKKLAKKLDELEATQRATAKALGVDPMTINKDIKPVENSTSAKNKSLYSNELQNGNVENSTKPYEKPAEEISKGLEKEAKREKREFAKQEKLEAEKEKAKNFVIDESICDFRNGDIKNVFNDIQDGSIDLILTDPPYPKEIIEVWSDLAILAKRVLKPNGFVIAYSGQLNLPEVMRRMSEHLQYYWTFSLIHTGSRQLVNARNLFCGWKPLLVFQNGFKKIETPVDDFINGSGLSKDLHEWQQSELELKPIIENFTTIGETILEPFAGSGTTMKAAIKLKRKVIGAEIDKDIYDIAKGGLSELF